MGFVKMGNKGSSPTLSIDDICVSANFGVKLTLKYMRVVLNLRLNLLYVGKFDDERCTRCLVKGAESLPRFTCSSKRKKVSHSLQNPIVLEERQVQYGGGNIYGSVAYTAQPHERERTTSSRASPTTFHHERYKLIPL